MFRAARVVGDRPASYAIRAQGVLQSDWSPVLRGMVVTITSKEELYPVVALTGRLTGQAELLDVLDTLYALGLPLLSVERMAADDERARI